ncbi:MAG: type II CRISPR RNA-guided endonuclease Cas9 [Rhodospirillaceae bacterium]
MRLGLDIGTNSIGWWLYALEDGEVSAVIDGGVRIFSNGRDPKSGASLAVDRRAARSMRRRRDRYLRRRASLMRKLAAAGLMPEDPEAAKALEAQDPYRLRAEGLERRLSLHQLGRALFHLNQRRGFKSNRKTDRGDNESGKIKDATARLDQAMMAAGAKTLGQFLFGRQQMAPTPRHTPAVRTRLTLRQEDPDEKAEMGYDFYPDRRHLENEFAMLWAAQQPHHPEVLTEDLRTALFETIFYQRPLKTPEVGLCLFTDERRIEKAHPLTQRRTLYETVNALRITSDGKARRSLTKEQRDRVIHFIDNRKPTKKPGSMVAKLTAIAKALGLKTDERFTLETGNRDAIACDPVRASLSHPDCFGPHWSTLSWEDQWQVISTVRAVQSDAEYAQALDWLQTTHGLDKSGAESVLKASLPEGFGRLGLSATQAILAKLQADVIPYSEAVAACGWHHSDSRTGEILDQLPYYGEVLDRHVIPGSGNPQDEPVERFGRLTNPTVHIGLNQLRRLVNRIIAHHGKPDQIVVEIARDLKLSDKQKKDFEVVNKSNRDAALARSKKLLELGQPDTGANRLLLRLYEELGPAIGPRRCPYTGKPVSATMLFDGSCDVDHILPYSRTLDDSPANRTLCLREANRDKRNLTPYECWGDTAQWEAIQANLANLPENKRWRFAPDAMARFEGERDFLDRALVDTQYLSRLARSYLDALYTEGGHVWVVPGRMTEMLRRHWGLNSLLPKHSSAGIREKKNRTDHRHHAIDAAVVAVCDRGLVKRMSEASASMERDGFRAEDVANNTPLPWPRFREDLRSTLDRIVVSHRADHGRIDPQARKQGRDSTTGQLHNDSAYGIVDDRTVVSRVPLAALKPSDLAGSARGKTLVDPDLREALLLATRGLGEGSAKAFADALVAFSARPGPYQGIRRVRLRETLGTEARVEIFGTDGQPYKAYKGDSNHCLEIWRLPDGKIVSQVITTFQAHQKEQIRPHPAAKRLMRLFKRDMVVSSVDGTQRVLVVQKFDPANGLFLVPHNESDADARHRNKDDPFKMLQISTLKAIKAGLRRVIVDEMGRVRDQHATE